MDFFQCASNADGLCTGGMFKKRAKKNMRASTITSLDDGEKAKPAEPVETQANAEAEASTDEQKDTERTETEEAEPSSPKQDADEHIASAGAASEGESDKINIVRKQKRSRTAETLAVQSVSARLCGEIALTCCCLCRRAGSCRKQRPAPRRT